MGGGGGGYPRAPSPPPLYEILLRINTSLVSSGQTLYQAAPLETNTSLLQRFTAESSRELMSSKEYRSALRKLNNKQRQVVMFLLFKLSSQFPFVSFHFLSISILSLLPSSILSLLPFLISPSLSTIPSFSFDQFSVLLEDEDFKFHSVSLLSKAPLARGSSALPSPFIPPHFLLPPRPHLALFSSFHITLLFFFLLLHLLFLLDLSFSYLVYFFSFDLFLFFTFVFLSIIFIIT